MTSEAERLMAEALKRVKLNGGFDPAALGAKIGLNKAQAEIAARALANAGVLVLGFDSSAQFSPGFRKNRSPDLRESTRKKARKAKRAASARQVVTAEV
jgi:hypothetical protein